MSELWTLAKNSTIFRACQNFFGLSQPPSSGASGNVLKLQNFSMCCVKTKRQAIIKNQNKIFHSHWDKRHKFPLRIDPFAARQTIQKKKNLVMLRGCPQFLSFSGALAAQGDYVWQPTWDKCLDTGHYGTWVLSAKLELDVSKLASVLWFIGLS